MGDWNRSTRENKLKNLHPESLAGIKKHIETYNLGSILDDYLLCIETNSEKKKKGLFSSGDKTVLVSVIVTPRWLVWAINGDKSGLGILSAQLRDVVVSDYANGRFAGMVQDTGIEVTGTLTGTFAGSPTEKGTVFIPLGEESIAQRFKETVIKAAQDAKK